MLAAPDFFAAVRSLGLRRVAGTPCSYLRPLIDTAMADTGLEFRAAVNEGDAVAFAAGGFVGTGDPEIVMFQNSGLGNAVNALTSLNWPFRIPVLIVVTHRGEPGGPPDEPQHELMGEITPALLDLLRIPWIPFPQDKASLAELPGRLRPSLFEARLPVAIVMPHGAVAADAPAPVRPTAAMPRNRLVFEENPSIPACNRASRADALRALLTAEKPSDLVVATTGYTGRELFALRDAPNHFYMVGSMGSVSAFGLGLALRQPSRRIFVIDGDGALLMRLGNLAAVGAHAAPNLLHLVLDNEVHESTGGQATMSRGCSFAAIAQACGYARVFATDRLDELSTLVAGHTALSGTTLIHFRTRPGTMPGLPRPSLSPFESRRRLMEHLGLRP